MTRRPPPLAVAVAGWSGAGKTSLLEHLLPFLAQQGIRAGYLKAHAHRIDFDPSDKDTERMRRAGAAVSAIHGQGGELHLAPRLPAPVAAGGEHRDALPDPAAREAAGLEARALLWNLRDLYQDCDLILCEGLKASELPKILVNREDNPRGILPAGPLEDVRLELRWPSLPVLWDEPVERAARLLLELLNAPLRRRGAETVGAVLAGGGSVRMGRDKASLALRGEKGSWLEHAFLHLADLCPEVWIIGRLSRPGGADLPLLRRPAACHLDLRPKSGPLAGLETALRVAGGRTVLALPCDLPDLTAHALQRILGADDASADAVVFSSPDGGFEPFPLLLRGNCLGEAAQALDQGDGALLRFLRGLSRQEISWASGLGPRPSPRNTPGERSSYERGAPDRADGDA